MGFRGYTGLVGRVHEKKVLKFDFDWFYREVVRDSTVYLLDIAVANGGLST